MSEDPRCCGSGTCIIDTAGRCWCGQQWDGHKMCQVPLVPAKASRSASGVHPAVGPAAGPAEPSPTPSQSAP